MIILNTTDIHIMGRNPRARLDNLPTAIFNKLDEINEIVRDRKVGVVFINVILINANLE